MMNRAERKLHNKAALEHEKTLIELLNRFYRFLDKQPKPADAEVREEFRICETTWKLYCVQHGLGIRTSLLFNARVSYEWERKYAKKKSRRKI